MTRDPSGGPSPWADWPLDREVVITRVVDAARERVFAAWTDPAQLPLWFGPDGYRIETASIDLRPGVAATMLASVSRAARMESGLAL